MLNKVYLFLPHWQIVSHMNYDLVEIIQDIMSECNL